mmetsp:Transcript_45189/g.98277  ORF Transcript_45189/g.98277 Transcript_45189/m.98277 type:complete len:218 (+) Transcript_45189:270-923(+)
MAEVICALEAHMVQRRHDVLLPGSVRQVAQHECRAWLCHARILALTFALALALGRQHLYTQCLFKLGCSLPAILDLALNYDIVLDDVRRFYKAVLLEMGVGALKPMLHHLEFAVIWDEASHVLGLILFALFPHEGAAVASCLPHPHCRPWRRPAYDVLALYPTVGDLRGWTATLHPLIVKLHFSVVRDQMEPIFRSGNSSWLLLDGHLVMGASIPNP